MAEKHYAVHKGKFFYDDLVGVITASPVVAAVLEGPKRERALPKTLTHAEVDSLLGVAGKIERSIIGAGLNPVDGVFGNEDDAVVGGNLSVIKSVTARGGADDGTRIAAGTVGAVRLPKKVAVGDPRIKTS